MTKQPQIVTIGGGSGAPTIIRSLVMAGYNNLISICASTDSGGRSGQVRTDERDQVISIGDIYNSIWALVNNKDAEDLHVKEFFASLAFTNGRNRKAGYDWFYSQLEALNGDFTKVQKRIETILQIRLHGIAVPATKQSTHLWFKTKNGRLHKGESGLDEQQMSKDEVTACWIDPVVDAEDDCLSAIEQADYIIYCPGSLYGSLITNFFPQGVIEALNRSESKVILIPNLVSDRNQTHKFTLQKYQKILSKYTHRKPSFDLAIVPNLSRSQFEHKYPEISKKYKDEHSHFLNIYDNQNHSPQILAEDIFLITPEGRVRHDPNKLHHLWKKIL